MNIFDLIILSIENFYSKLGVILVELTINLMIFIKNLIDVYEKFKFSELSIILLAATSIFLCILILMVISQKRKIKKKNQNKQRKYLSNLNNHPENLILLTIIIPLLTSSITSVSEDFKISDTKSRENSLHVSKQNNLNFEEDIFSELEEDYNVKISGQNIIFPENNLYDEISPVRNYNKASIGKTSEIINSTDALVLLNNNTVSEVVIIRFKDDYENQRDKANYDKYYRKGISYRNEGNNYKIYAKETGTELELTQEAIEERRVWELG